MVKQCAVNLKVRYSFLELASPEWFSTHPGYHSVVLWSKAGQSMKLTTHLHLIPGLMMLILFRWRLCCQHFEGSYFLNLEVTEPGMEDLSTYSYRTYSLHVSASLYTPKGQFPVTIHPTAVPISPHHTDFSSTATLYSPPKIEFCSIPIGQHSMHK